MDKKQTCGELGETLVRRELLKIGYSFNPISEQDWWDSEKDGYAFFNGVRTTFEVKTQMPFYVRKAFSVKLDQIKKIDGVDRVFFLAIPVRPGSRYDTDASRWFDGKIFSLLPKLKYERYAQWIVAQQETRALIPILQTNGNMTIVGQITDPEELQLLRDLSSSEE